MTPAPSTFFEQAKHKRILWALAAIWLLEAGMNTLYGYRRGGGGVGAMGYAAVFFAIAIMAAWLPVKMQELRAVGMGAIATGRRRRV